MEIAGVKLKENGAKRVVPLAVSGAFHSPLMEKAREEFSGIVESIDVKDAAIPVFCNVTAEQVTNADEIRKLMLKQLVSPVRWVDTVVNIVSSGVDTAYEIGPGAVLAGLIRRIDSDLTVISVSNAAAI
ncbi:Malonyl CoA-acyl carrier protein transacylase [subsurface metagenome]